MKNFLRSPRPLPLLSLFFLFSAHLALAGPPFQTDDPEPVPLHHHEAYLFGTVDSSGGDTFSQGPAFEYNIGAAPNLQLHIIIPGAYDSSANAFGMGDMELGAKYRFVTEKGKRPEIGTFPMLEVPTGNNRLGLGNGQVWARLPVWIQKDKGSWTTYGGAGYQINHAPGNKDSLFSGWLLQKQLAKWITLGGEIYYQSAQMVDTHQTTYMDGGGYYYFTPNLQLLFMGGHTVSGDNHTVGYLGLYYTW
jgi:Putative MetA-pathway of phenol degradation